ncbi:hypothetical protein CY652_00745 [Burkholderia sp. WAC0059]|uniref:hypothetical protein n=1 Tax=Burkholderia sp. WAC0059 TaxID=2066022 RepID=UPI000C7F4375|nr:hypothetical protein [Burkholderia sp. WAC0059]PLZ04241.1 hypothetical protein CY652_00745 [Burkholderia sp. WAC0059]
MKKNRALTGAMLAMLTLLSGCIQFVSVKDIAKDEPGYLAANFGVDALPASVRSRLPAAGAHPLPFRQLIASGTLTGHTNTARIDSDFKATFINAGDTGLVQEVLEVSANGIPSNVSFNISYLNIYELKAETAAYAQSIAFIPFMVHGVDNDQFAFDVPKEDETYTTRFRIGTTVQIANFSSMVETCHAGHYYLASQINPALTGKAIDLDCEETRDGIVQNKGLHTYLTEYGIALSRSFATSTAKLEWNYGEFEKDGQKTPTRLDKAVDDKSV